MIHSTAIIDPSAQIDSDVSVGPYCVIGANSRIGSGTELMERVSVGPNTSLGRDNLLYPGTVLGGDPQDLSHRRDHQVRCAIGDRNVLRECVTVNRGTLKDTGTTLLGDDNLLMACCHVAHDCIVENHTVIANGVLLAGHVTVKSGVVFSGMTGAAQFVTVGRLAYVAGLTAASQDVPPFVKVQGSDVRGLNTLGIKRAGIDEKVQEDLRRAYRTVWMSDLTLTEALAEMAAWQNKPAEVVELADFLQAKSTGRFGRARENTRTW